MSNERMDRVEANLDRITALLLETAERQSANEHAIAELKAAMVIDAENIRRLANIAAAHESRIDDLEDGNQ